MFRAITLLAFFCTTVSAQTVEVRKILTGIDCLETQGGIVLVDAKSDPKVESVGYVDLGKIPEKPQVLRLTVTDSKRQPVPSEAIGLGKWIIRGTGKVWIDARVIDLPTQFIFDESWTLDIPSDKPAPKPEPEPGPTPNPSPVPNEYNIGQSSIAAAPADSDIAKQLANVYRFHAGRLFGQPNFAPIQTILAEVNRTFAAKQCRDQATCLAWDKWKSVVDQSLIAEQRRRGTFTQKDWYNALIEIAMSLEAVK